MCAVKRVRFDAGYTFPHLGFVSIVAVFSKTCGHVGTCRRMQSRSEGGLHWPTCTPDDDPQNRKYYLPIIFKACFCTDDLGLHAIFFAAYDGPYDYDYRYMYANYQRKSVST